MRAAGSPGQCTIPVFSGTEISIHGDGTANLLFGFSFIDHSARAEFTATVRGAEH
jgi:hypothetical protein